MSPPPPSAASDSSRRVIYTDGACSGNPGPGGWGWVMQGGGFAIGCESQSTNQRMELAATLDAIENNEGLLHIVSDSTYVVNCFRDSWWKGWLARGWVNKAKKPVANRDLWEPLIELYQQRDVTFEWVKGHSGDEWNDIADRLAVEGATTQKPRRGNDMPTDLGEADAISGPTGSATAAGSAKAKDPTGRAAPEGHVLVVGGHRPPDIGGYDPNPTAKAIRRRLVDIIAAKKEVSPDLVVVSGMGLGAEQLAAEAALDADVPFVAVLAFPDPAAVWPAASRKRYDEIVERASDVIVLQAKVPETKAKIAGAMKRRDAWFVRNADEALVVWDGKDKPLGTFVRSLGVQLGDDVWVIDPSEL